MANPPPRPALRKAADSDLHPAAARRATSRSTAGGGGGKKLQLVADAAAGSAGKGGKPGKKGGGAAAVGKTVTVKVQMPKALRARLQERAAEHGMSVDRAAAEVLRMWLDG